MQKIKPKLTASDNDEDRRLINFYLDRSDLETFKILAIRRRQSMANIIRHVLKDWLKKQGEIRL